MKDQGAHEEKKRKQDKCQLDQGIANPMLCDGRDRQKRHDWTAKHHQHDFWKVQVGEAPANIGSGTIDEITQHS